jgi:hypothetical protein
MIVQITAALPFALEALIVKGKPCIRVLPMQELLYGAIIDQVDVDKYPNGISAIFDAEGFTLWENTVSADYVYHCPYPYKEMPVLKQWLTQQEMIMPEGF